MSSVSVRVSVLAPEETVVEEDVPQLPPIAMVPSSATFMVTSGLPSLPGVDTAVVSVAADTDTS